MKSTGVAYGYVLGAYILWGVLPIFWMLLSDIDPLTVLFQRTVWSVLLLGTELLRRGELSSVIRSLLAGEGLGAACISTLCLGINWSLYVWAMKSGNLFAASLAYYICPLLTMAGAALVFKERFAKRQKFAIIFLAAGVVLPAVLERALPILALLIAASWSIYTLTRSYFNRPALHALFIETLLLAFALLVILPAVCETGVLWPAEADARLVGLFVLSGLVTTIPIMLLLEGMKIVPLRVVGILQYLAPTLTLAVSVFYSGATVTRGQLLSLALVWIGLALSFSAEISRFVTICARRSVALSRVLFRGRRGYVEEELLDVS